MDRELLIHLCDEYSLGLLEGAERDELEALLRSGDGAARDQLRRSEEFVAQLALLAPPAAPPASLRARVLSSTASSTAATSAAVPAATSAAQPAAPAPVIEIRAARPAPAKRSWALGWAAAAALAVMSGYSYFALRTTRGELETAQAQLASARGEAERTRRVLNVIFSRDARFVKLSTAEQTPTFRAFWGPASGLVLAGANVPAPANGRTFQLWVVPKQGNPISAGVFAPGANGQVLMIAESPARPEDAAALAISDEPTGGSAQPTTKPVFVGNVGD